MPDLRESSPSKIAAGFGGTLSLVVSSLFIMVVVIVAALPTHLFLFTHAFGQGASESAGFLLWAGSTSGVATSMGLVIFVSLVATCVPLAFGLRSFRRLEP